MLDAVFFYLEYYTFKVQQAASKKKKKKHTGEGMRINFTFQLDWATGGPGTWSNVILGLSVKVLLDDTDL